MEQLPCYYHIGFTLPAGVDPNAIQEAIDDKVIDWLRYSANCYIVWSAVDAATLAGTILSVSGMSKTHFLVMRIDMSDGFGWLPAWIWEWLHRDRTTQLGLFEQTKQITPPQK
jgi:hypothetical protein